MEKKKEKTIGTIIGKDILLNNLIYIYNYFILLHIDNLDIL